MKVNREALKELIKECIVEVLSEGVGHQSVSRIVESTPQRSRVPMVSGQQKVMSQQRSRQPKYDPALDAPIRTDEVVSIAAAGNKVLESIMRDTAASDTFRNMTDTPAPGAAPQTSAVEHVSGSPLDIFGQDMASKWGALAFSSKKTTS